MVGLKIGKKQMEYGKNAWLWRESASIEIAAVCVLCIG